MKRTHSDMGRFEYGLRNNVPGAVIGLAANAVMLLTLGYYAPGWEFSHAARSIQRDIKRRKANEKEQSR